MLMNRVNEPSPQALVEAVNAMLQPNQDSLLPALQRLRLSIQDITRTLGQMHGMGLLRVEGCAWGRAGQYPRDGASVSALFYGNCCFNYWRMISQFA